VLRGIKLDPKNPFRFHFFVDRGESSLSQEELKTESSKLIKYFLASLTIPEKDLWVYLSPYEKDRIVPQEFGQTEMGRDLLAEDYLLKQITASLLYPESQLGKEFWQKVYAQAQAKYGTTNIPINTFNKVWIVPEKAVVYENGGVAFVLENHLKVMLEQDYLSLAKHEGIQSKQTQAKDTNQLGSQIVREIVIPALTKEVNEGKNFTQLRQVFYSLILATWYKKKIKDSILNKVYSNRNKIGGVNVSAGDKDKIYQEYLRAFKKGVYNYIKEEPDQITGQTIPRKYFSGGVQIAELINPAIEFRNLAMITSQDMAALSKSLIEEDVVTKLNADRAMGARISSDRVILEVKEALKNGWLTVNNHTHSFGKSLFEMSAILMRHSVSALKNPFDMVRRIVVSPDEDLNVKDYLLRDPDLTALEDQMTTVSFTNLQGVNESIGVVFPKKSIGRLGHNRGMSPGLPPSGIDRAMITTDAVIQKENQQFPDRQESLRRLINTPQDLQVRAEALKVLGADMRLFDNRFLNPLRLAQFSAIKKMINPTNEDELVGVYLAAGSDISGFLELTNNKEGYFVDLTPIHAERFNQYLTDEGWASLDETKVSELNDYRMNKWAAGWIASDQEGIKGFERKILYELKQMGVKRKTVRIDSTDGVVSVSFKWAYYGLEEKPRVIYFITSNILNESTTSSVLERVKGGANVVLIKAGLDLPYYYDKFLTRYVDVLKTGGFLVTDNYFMKQASYFNGYFPERHGVYGYSDPDKILRKNGSYDFKRARTLETDFIQDEFYRRIAPTGTVRNVRDMGDYVIGSSDSPNTGQRSREWGWLPKLRESYPAGIPRENENLLYGMGLQIRQKLDKVNVQRKEVSEPDEAMTTDEQQRWEKTGGLIGQFMTVYDKFLEIVPQATDKYIEGLNYPIISSIQGFKSNWSLLGFENRMTSETLKLLMESLDEIKSYLDDICSNYASYEEWARLAHKDVLSVQQRAKDTGSDGMTYREMLSFFIDRGNLTPEFMDKFKGIKSEYDILYPKILNEINYFAKRDGVIQNSSNGVMLNEQKVVLSAEDARIAEEIYQKVKKFPNESIWNDFSGIGTMLYGLTRDPSDDVLNRFHYIELNIRSLDRLIEQVKMLDKSRDNRRIVFFDNLNKLINGELKFEKPFSKILEFWHALNNKEAESKLKQWDDVIKTYQEIRPSLVALIGRYIKPIKIDIMDESSNKVVFAVEQLYYWYAQRGNSEARGQFDGIFMHPLRDLNSAVNHFFLEYDREKLGELNSMRYLAMSKAFEKALLFISTVMNLDLKQIRNMNLQAQERLGVVTKREFEKEKIGHIYDAILPDLIKEGYVTKNHQVNQKLYRLKEKFKYAHAQEYSPEELAKVDVVLKHLYMPRMFKRYNEIYEELDKVKGIIDPIERSEAEQKLKREKGLLWRNIGMLNFVSHEDWFDGDVSRRLGVFYQELVGFRQLWQAAINSLMKEKGLSVEQIKKEDKRATVKGAKLLLVDNKQVWVASDGFLIQSDQRPVPNFQEFRELLQKHSRNHEFETMPLDLFVKTVQNYVQEEKIRITFYEPNEARLTAIQYLINEGDLMGSEKNSLFNDVKVEILWRAGIKPDKAMQSLPPTVATREALHKTISHGGSVQITNTGGIDLNPVQMNIQVKKQSEDFKFNFNGTEIDAAQVTGATFTIRTMTPVINLPQVLGLIQEPADKLNLIK
jgi:hypothetical protein